MCDTRSKQSENRGESVGDRERVTVISKVLRQREKQSVAGENTVSERGGGGSVL